MNVPRGGCSHPSNGGSGGYDQDWRRDQIIQADQGLPITGILTVNIEMRAHLEPCYMSGYKVLAIRDLDLFHLIRYRMIYLKANADEVRRFIFENNPTNAVVFSRLGITLCEQLLDMRRLKAATTANFGPLHLQWAFVLLPMSLF